jgi:hypothetical protein
MKIVNAHIVAKPNATAMDFQQKTKINNSLQHIKPNVPKMFVVKDLICGKAIGGQKNVGFEKGGQFSFFFVPYLH